jgi:hypothetical protein
MADQSFSDPSGTPPTSANRLDSSAGTPGKQGKTSAAPEALKRRRRVRRTLITLLIVLILLGIVWTWIALTFAYANGEKRGYVQKLTRSGWVCKTWEGELAVTPLPGTSVGPSVFQFTIRDDSVATALQRATGQMVILQYDHHRGIPTSCFGETQDFVTGFRLVP